MSSRGSPPPTPHGRPCLRRGRYPQKPMVDHVFDGVATPNATWSTMSSTGSLPPKSHGRPCLRRGRYPQRPMVDHVFDGVATPKATWSTMSSTGSLPQSHMVDHVFAGVLPPKLQKKWHHSPFYDVLQQESNPETLDEQRIKPEALLLSTIVPICCASMCQLAYFDGALHLAPTVNLTRIGLKCGLAYLAPSLLSTDACVTRVPARSSTVRQSQHDRSHPQSPFGGFNGT